MTYTFRTPWGLLVVWDFGTAGADVVACRYPVCGCRRFCKPPVFPMSADDIIRPAP